MEPRICPKLSDEALEEIFFIDPANRAFAAGKSSRLPARRGHLFFAFLGSAFLGLSCVGATIVGYEWGARILLAVCGDETTGTALKVTQHADSEGGMTYWLYYEFFVGADHPTRFEADQQIGSRSNLRAGDPVPVRYCPAYPKLSRAGGAAAGWGNLIVASFTVALFAAFGGLFFMAYIRARRDVRQFERQGELARGVVLSAQNQRKVEGAMTLDLQYRIEFEDAAPIVERKSVALPTSPSRDIPPPGTPLLALCIPGEKHMLL